MKRLKFLLVLTVLSFSISACSSINTQQLGLVGKPVEPFLLTLIDYSDLPSESLLGKTVVLSFWDASCPKCKKAMPMVNELARSFGSTERALFVAVNVNDRADEDKVKDEIGYLSLDSLTHAFSGYAFQDEAYRAVEGSSVPYFVILDTSGTVRWIGDDTEDLKDVFLKIHRNG